MTRRNWKAVRPNSLVEAMRLCKEFAQEKRQLSVERIADRMGISHDSLYKYLASGRLPAILIPAYEHTCGRHFITEWQAASAGKLVIDMPTGRTAGQTDMVALNTGFAAALQVLTDFYAHPGKTSPDAILAALGQHLQQVAWHQANVIRHTEPEFDFKA